MSKPEQVDMSQDLSQAAPEKRPRGRPPGALNKTTSDLRQLIMRRGAPIEFLCKVVKGKPIKVGTERQIPTLEARIVAATKLMERLVPVPKPEDAPLPDAAALARAKGTGLDSRIDTARRVAFLLTQGVHALSGPPRLEAIDGGRAPAAAAEPDKPANLHLEQPSAPALASTPESRKQQIDYAFRGERIERTTIPESRIPRGTMR